MKKVLRSLIPLCMVTLTVACKKDNASNTGNVILDRVIYTSSNSTEADTTLYTYNALNSLVSVTTTSNLPNIHGDRYSFTYDPGGQLTGFTYTDAITGNILGGSFQYDNNGRIIRNHGIALLANLQVNDEAYAYDAQGRMIADSQIYQKTQAVLSYATFTYDANNDVTEMDGFEIINGSFQKTNITTYTYDSRRNAFAGTYPAMYVIFNGGDISLLSPHNILSQQTKVINNPAASRSTSTSYWYYPNGLVWRLRSTNSSSSNPGWTEFHFKSY